MIVLGIDTSGSTCSIGISQGDLLLGELTLEMQWTWLERLIPEVNYILTQKHLSVSDVNLLSVVLGPGSWTGLRVGVTAVKTLSYTLNKPVVGISSLDALAHNLRHVDKDVYPVIDAEKGGVYFARYDCRGAIPQLLTEYNVSSIEDLLNCVELPALFLGDGGRKYRQVILSRFGDNAVIAPPLFDNIRGGFVAEAGLHKYARSGPDDGFALAPLYLQKRTI